MRIKRGSRLGRRKFSDTRGLISFSDRSGAPFPYDQMVYEKGTNLWVHRTEDDGDWNITEIGKDPIVPSDAQMIKEPRGLPPAATQAVAQVNLFPDDFTGDGGGGGGEETVLTPLNVAGFGDSTEEHHFTQFSSAGQLAMEGEGEKYFSPFILFDAARSGSYLLESTALTVSAGNVNLFWVDNSGALANGSQLTNNVINFASDPGIYIGSLGINDTAGVTTETSDNFKDAYVYLAGRVDVTHNADTILNTLGRDTGGNDSAANIVFEGQKKAYATGLVKRGVDVYDLALTDAKHHTQAGQEAKARREATRIAYLLEKGTNTALGPSASAVFKTDELIVTLTHSNGSNFTMQTSGNGGMALTDDGTVLSSVTYTKTSPTEFKMVLADGTAPKLGSALKYFIPFGANGLGLNGAAPDVIRDNSTLALPIQRDILTVTNQDPFEGLNNLVMYIEARASAKLIDNTNEVYQITSVGGSINTIAEVDAGDHFLYNTGVYNNHSSFEYQSNSQMLYTGFTAGGTHTQYFYFKTPSTSNFAGDLMFWANSGGGTDNQAKLVFFNGLLYYANNESATSEIISNTLAPDTLYRVRIEYVDVNTLNAYWDGETTPSFSINPVSDYNAWNSILLGARTAGSENGACVGLELLAYAHTTDLWTTQEASDIDEYFTERYEG